MKYYKMLRDDENSKERDVVCRTENGYEEKYGVTKNIIYTTDRINNWNDELEFIFSEAAGNHFIDFLPNNLGWYIVSKKVKSIFNRMNLDNEVQFLPIKIREIVTGNIIYGYSVMNILNLVDAFDYSNSEYKEMKVKDTSMYLIKKYALIREKTKGYNCLRIPENKFAAFFSEMVVNILVNENVSGIDFLEVRVN